MLTELIDGLLPKNEVSILAGASGAGKTTLLMYVIKCLQTNEPVFGHKVEKNLKVGYIAADRTWEAYKRLADTTGVDLNQMHVRALIDDDNIDTENFERNPQSLMYKLLKEMHDLNVHLVIVDPLVVFMGCDTRMYHVNAARLIQLNRFCRKHDLTILGTHHATKARSDFTFKRPQDRINGSGALLGFTSTQLFLAAADETGNEYTEWHIISHHAPAKVIQLKRGENGLFVQADPEMDFTDKAEQAAGAIISMLPPDGTPMQKKQIFERTKLLNPRTVDEQLKVLIYQGVVAKHETGWYGINLKAKDS